MRLIITASLISLVSACASTPHGPIPGEQAYTPAVASAPAQIRVNKGSIYQPQNEMVLFGDKRSNRVGDIITIRLVERTVSTKSADTTTSKNASNSLSSPDLLGPLSNELGLGVNLGKLNDVDHQRGFSGSAASDMSNSLSGNITVTVSEVLPNGVLAVRGEKWMTLNRGEEYIRIRGLIRPEDIESDNTIISTKLADARITYSGTGELADTNRSGWLTRFFNSVVWPF
jgi:flagellar L-ring protein precursor FlgH